VIPMGRDVIDKAMNSDHNPK